MKVGLGYVDEPLDWWMNPIMICRSMSTSWRDLMGEELPLEAGYGGPSFLAAVDRGARQRDKMSK